MGRKQGKANRKKQAKKSKSQGQTHASCGDELLYKTKVSKSLAQSGAVCNACEEPFRKGKQCWQNEKGDASIHEICMGGSSKEKRSGMDDIDARTKAFQEGLEMLQSGKVKHFSRDLDFPFTMAHPDGGAILLDSAQIKITSGHRYGLIGRNGAGKSTLLKHLASYQIPQIPKYLKVLHVAQELEGTAKSVLETVIEADTERTALLTQQLQIEKQLESIDDADNTQTELTERYNQVLDRLSVIDADTADKRAMEILNGLCFSPAMQGMKTEDLSGGWRMRVSLAQALFVEPDIMLLDEPTNHLDVPSVQWLEHYLQNYPDEKSLVVVSHDRSFLDTVCTDIMHTSKAKLKYYSGNFSQFQKTKKEADKNQRTLYDKQQREIAHQKDFIRRFSANKKLSTQAQSRAKLLAKMERDGLIEEPEDEAQFSFEFPKADKPKVHSLVNISKMSFGYFGHDVTKETYLLKNVNIKVEFGGVYGLIGANGAGKSTMLKLIMQELEPVEGTAFMPNSVDFGYFSQHHMETMDLQATPMEYLRKTFGSETTQQQVWAQLGRFGISNEMAAKKIERLSGGEKSRIAFAVLAWYRPSLMIMDEPTNHLDFETIEGLIGAVKGYGGSAIIVSHDKHFLKSICTEYWGVGNQRVKIIKTFEEAMAYSNKCGAAKQMARLGSKIKKPAKPERPKKTASVADISESMKKTSLENTIDCLRQVNKLCDDKVTPRGCLRIIRGWRPSDTRNQHIIATLGGHVFDAYFAVGQTQEAGAEMLAEHADLIRYLIPEDHSNNQAYWAFLAQSKWFNFMEAGSKLAMQPGAILKLFKQLDELKIVTQGGWTFWHDDTSTRWSCGKPETLEQVEDWITGMK